MVRGETLRGWVIAGVVLLAGPRSAIAGGGSSPPERYEEPRILAVAELLPSELRSGPGFTIESPVATDGFMGEYRIRTAYGRYHVRGRFGVVNLINELAALEQLQKFTDSKVFLDAAKDAGIGIVTAPIRGVEKVYGAVTDPAGTWQTVRKVPAGVRGIFEEIGDAFESGYRSVRRAVQSSDRSKGEDVGGGAEDLGDAATKAALDYVGYSSRESVWYEQVRVDPYTRNKPLRDRVSRIATIQSAVGLGFKFVPGIGGLPYIGTITDVLGKAQFISGYASPREIRGKSRQLLMKRRVPEESIGRLLGNASFTPTALAALVESIGKLPEVRGLERVVDAAARATSADGAWFHARAVQHTATTLHDAVVSFERTGDFTVATKRDGTVVVPLPVDYLSWSAVAAPELRGLKHGEPRLKVEIALEGRASNLCRLNTARLGITLREQVNFLISAPVNGAGVGRPGR